MLPGDFICFIVNPFSFSCILEAPDSTEAGKIANRNSLELSKGKSISLIVR